MVSKSQNIPLIRNIKSNNLLNIYSLHCESSVTAQQLCYLHNRCSLIGQKCVTYTPSISCNHFCWWTTCCHCSGNIIFVVYGMWCIRITTKLQRRKIKVSWSFLASYFSHYSVVKYDDCGLYTAVGRYWYGLLYIFIIEIYSS
jgi:hypothetical protein